jgi:hypothetical protein
VSEYLTVPYAVAFALGVLAQVKFDVFAKLKGLVSK